MGKIPQFQPATGLHSIHGCKGTASHMSRSEVIGSGNGRFFAENPG